MGKLFVPHRLKTIEIDVEKNIFRINGEDFGEGCTGFSITCLGYGEFDIRVEVDTTVRFVSIRDGECVADRERQTDDTWFSDRPERPDNSE